MLSIDCTRLFRGFLTPRRLRPVTAAILCGLALSAHALDPIQRQPIQRQPIQAKLAVPNTSPLAPPAHRSVPPTASSTQPVLSIGSITIAPQPPAQKSAAPTRTAPHRARRPARRKLRPSDLLAPTYLLNRA